MECTREKTGPYDATAAAHDDRQLHRADVHGRVAAVQQGAVMFDAERLLGNLLTGTLSQALGGRGGPILRGGAIGSRAQIGMGLLGLAIAAYEQFQLPPATGGGHTASPPPPPPGMAPAPRAPMTASPPPPPPPSAARSNDAVVIVRAMIAAAQADGTIDADERARILGAASNLGDAERHFLAAELDAPQSIEAIVAEARPQIAHDLYAAAAHAIVPDSEAERAWLARLGEALGIDTAGRASIERQMTIA
jgi:uncharacterized membrane protein YebE (DUF533 family)